MATIRPRSLRRLQRRAPCVASGSTCCFSRTAGYTRTLHLMDDFAKRAFHAADQVVVLEVSWVRASEASIEGVTGSGAGSGTDGAVRTPGRIVRGLQRRRHARGSARRGAGRHADPDAGRGQRLAVGRQNSGAIAQCLNLLLRRNAASLRAWRCASGCGWEYSRGAGMGRARSTLVFDHRPAFPVRKSWRFGARPTRAPRADPECVRVRFQPWHPADPAGGAEKARPGDRLGGGTAAITRVWPDRIVVTVTERKPVAFAKLPVAGTLRHWLALIDDEGILLSSAEGPVRAARAERYIGGAER